MHSENTQRTYEAAWASYRQWCENTRNDAMTGDPLIIAGYLSSVADRLAVNSIRTHLTAIAGKYRAMGISIDTKHRAIVDIVSRAKRLGQNETRLAVPLVPKQLTAMVRCVPPGPIGMRDRAILLVGYWLGMNLLDLVKIDAERLVSRGDDIVVEDESDPPVPLPRRRLVLRPCLVAEACPVRAVKEWLVVRGGQDGPLFPRILKGGKITQDHLSGSYVNLLTKRLASAAGLEAHVLSGRSLRSGVAGSTTFSRVAARIRDIPDVPAKFLSGLNKQPTSPMFTEDDATPSEQISVQEIASISIDSNARWEIRLGMMIDELSRLQSAVMSERMKHLGATRIQYIALSQISASSGLAQADLAKRLNLTKEGVSGLVSRLVSGGWVRRQVDERDSRVRWIYLTDKARDLMAELRHVAEQVTITIFRNITEDTGFDLLRVLGGMKAVLVAMAEADVQAARPQTIGSAGIA